MYLFCFVFVFLTGPKLLVFRTFQIIPFKSNVRTILCRRQMALSSKEGRLKWEPFPPGAKDDTKQERLFGELRGKTVILLHSFKVALT